MQDKSQSNNIFLLWLYMVIPVTRKIQFRTINAIKIQKTLRACYAMRQYKHRYKGCGRLRILAKQLENMMSIIHEMKGEPHKNAKENVEKTRFSIEKQLLKVRVYKNL